VFVEPASAVALAAVRADAEAGRIGADDYPCVVLTGHGLKDLGRFQGPVAEPDIVQVGDLAGRVSGWFADGGPS
jgi:threonine synthase